MYEGEVIELTPEEAESQTGGYGKVIASVVIGLKTVKARRTSCLLVYMSVHTPRSEGWRFSVNVCVQVLAASAQPCTHNLHMRCRRRVVLGVLYFITMAAALSINKDLSVNKTHACARRATST